MAERVVLHVGAMKSGTSYIQGQLFANKKALRSQGVLVPGARWHDQIAAVVDVIGRSHIRERDVRGSWARLVKQVDRWPGTAVVSMEFLGPQGPRKVQRVAESFPGAQVSVVLTARDLNRSIAAMWQETIQNGRDWTWEHYRADVEAMRPGNPGRRRDPAHHAGRTFWRQQNIVRILRTWKRDEGVDDVTLVTVPPPGAPPDELMVRFGQVAGFDAAGLEPSTRENASLDTAAVEVLRRVNALLEARDLPFPHGASLRKQQLAKDVLAGMRRSDLRLGLPVAAWVESHAERMENSLRRRLKVPVVGDWRDLDPVALAGADPATLPAADLAGTAERAVAQLGPTLVRLLGEDWERELDDVGGEDDVDRQVGRLARLVEQAIVAKQHRGR